MKTSPYLEQTLSFEQSPATDQYFEFRASNLFELQEGNSSLKIHVQRPDQGQSIDQWNLVKKSDPKQDFDGDVEPPSPIDWHRYPRQNPPRYVGGSGLEQQRVSNIKDLETIASVRKLTVPVNVYTDVILNQRRQRNAFVCGMYIYFITLPRR